MTFQHDTLHDTETKCVYTWSWFLLDQINIVIILTHSAYPSNITNLTTLFWNSGEIVLSSMIAPMVESYFEDHCNLTKLSLSTLFFAPKAVILRGSFHLLLHMGLLPRFLFIFPHSQYEACFKPHGIWWAQCRMTFFIIQTFVFWFPIGFYWIWFMLINQ